MKLITWIKSTPAGKLAWRLVIAFFGGIVTALGVLLVTVLLDLGVARVRLVRDHHDQQA